jgi:hypothetical protein
MRAFKLPEKPPAPRRGHTALHLLWVIPGSGSTDPIESESSPDPEHWVVNNGHRTTGTATLILKYYLLVHIRIIQVLAVPRSPPPLQRRYNLKFI